MEKKKKDVKNKERMEIHWHPKGTISRVRGVSAGQSRIPELDSCTRTKQTPQNKETKTESQPDKGRCAQTSPARCGAVSALGPARKGAPDSSPKTRAAATPWRPAPGNLGVPDSPGHAYLPGGSRCAGSSAPEPAASSWGPCREAPPFLRRARLGTDPHSARSARVVSLHPRCELSFFFPPLLLLLLLFF